MAYGCFSRAHKYTKRRVCVSGAQAAAKAKRAEAERMAVADAQKIVAIRNARQAVGAAEQILSTLTPKTDIASLASFSVTCR